MKPIILAAIILSVLSDASAVPNDQGKVSIYTRDIDHIDYAGLQQDLSALLHKRAYEIESLLTNQHKLSSRSLHRRTLTETRKCENTFGRDGIRPCNTEFEVPIKASRRYCSEACRSARAMFDKRRKRAANREAREAEKAQPLPALSQHDASNASGSKSPSGGTAGGSASETRGAESPKARAPGQDGGASPPGSPTEEDWQMYFDLPPDSPTTSQHGASSPSRPQQD